MNRFLIPLSAVSILICFHAFSAEPPTAPPADIESAFLRLPLDWLHPSPGGNVSEADRRSWIDRVDRRNGYLKFSGKSTQVWEGYGECAWFKRVDATPLVAVSLLTCGPACEQSLRFVTFESGVWKDVTATVFTPLPDERIRQLYAGRNGPAEFAQDPPVVYQLPRFGTGIELRVQEQIVGKSIILGVLRLKDGRFTFDPDR